MSKVKLPVG